MYCSNIWLVCSVCLSPSRWYLEVKWRVMSNAFPSEWKKWDTNSEPQSDVTWDGTSCFEKTCKTNSFASSADKIVSWVRMNIACLVSQWTTMRIAWELQSIWETRQLLNEIHGDRITRLLGYWKLLEKSIWLMTLRIERHASCAGLAKDIDQGVDSRPYVFAAD